MSEPSMSVIIPTVGRPDMALACVRSIINGTYTDFEILIIDQDASRLLESRLDEQFPGESRIRYFFVERVGVSGARNAGIQQARGKIVAFIDDDMLAEPRWLAAFAEAYATIEPPPGLVGGRIQPLWPEGRKPDWLPDTHQFTYALFDLGDKLCQVPEPALPPSGNSAIRRELILEFGGYNTALGRHNFRKFPKLGGEDSLLAIQLKNTGYKLYYQPEALTYHRLPASRVTRRNFLEWHFWEGVTKAMIRWHLGELQPTTRGPMMLASLWQMVRAMGLFIVPGFQGRHRPPNQATRMLALSKLVYHSGLIRGLFIARKSSLALQSTASTQASVAQWHKPQE